ncbi:MAG TPA: hypothetical protein VFE77_05380 [Rhodanobacter sp.]|nr:hypothetical protein [Rhodanobacter sp.]
MESIETGKYQTGVPASCAESEGFNRLHEWLHPHLTNQDVTAADIRVRHESPSVPANDLLDGTYADAASAAKSLTQKWCSRIDVQI